MALSPDSTWTAEANKVNSRPVYLANLEYDYYRAGVTYQADFKGSGYAGDADLDTIPGKIICKKATGEILNNDAWVSSTKTMPLVSSSSLARTVIGTRIKITKTTVLNSIVFDVKTDGSTTFYAVASIYPIKDDIENSSTTNLSLSFGDPIAYTRQFLCDTAYSTITYYPKGQNLSDGQLELTPGTYAFMIYAYFPPTADNIVFKSYYPNDLVFNARNSLYGFGVGGIQLGNFYAVSNPITDANTQTVWGNINNYLSSASAGGVGFSSTYPSFDGYIFLKELNIDVFADSTYTSPWMRVENTAGTGVTPATPGQLRFDYIKPLNTDVTFDFYGDADGSDAGEVLIDGTAFDGDTISNYYDYYKIVCALTTTDWFSTPEISSLSAYFKLTNDYCKFDDTFVMDSGAPARPYLDAVPSYETRVDPVNNRVSFNEPTIDLLIQKKGLSKTQSDIEAMIETYYMTGKELSIKVGYAQNIASANFLPYQTGITNNQIWLDDNTYRLECKDPYFQTKDPFLLDSADSFQPYFSYDNPIDIMLTLISLSGISQRLIDTSSFSSIKSTYFTGWEFYRPYTEPIKDIKKELDEIARLTGVVAVTKEDGKIYAVKLDNAAGTVAKKPADSQTFNDQNSKAIGKANIDLSKRVNVCSVQRGYWIEPSDQQSKDLEYWETEVDEESILDVGRSEVLKIENKWIPKDTTIAGVALSKIVAQRMVARFRYGLWTMKRQTDLSFAFIQVGDQVTLLSSQILYKGFYGEKSFRGVVIGKEVRPSAGEYEGEIEFTIWVYENIAATLEPEPTAQGTSLAFSSVTTSQIILDWTDASPACTGYVALFKTGDYPNTLPEDGVQYTAADVVNDATVAYRNTTSGFTHSSLSADTEYFYKIFSYNDSGTAASTNYNKISPLIGSRWTSATEPGNQPTTFVFGAFTNSTTTTVSWTASAGSPAAEQYIIVRKSGGAVTWAPTDANGYTVGSEPTTGETIRYIGSAVTFTDTDISFNGTTYHYAAYAFRGSDATSYNYKTGSPLTGNKASSVGEPTAQPIDLDGDGSTTTEMTLTWLHANPVCDSYIVLYRKASSSTGVPVDTNTYTTASTIGDSGVGYVGYAETCTVTGLTSGQYYIFKIFAFNGSGGAENYLTTSPPSFYGYVA